MNNYGFRQGSMAVLLWLCLSGCSKTPESTPAEPMPIEPRVSVGGIRAGMTIAQVRELLGEPERKTANALEYTHRGFAVMPDSDGVVQVVMCGDVTGLAGPLVKRFAGRTKEGIGLESTREELITAFGEPTTDEKFPGARESMKYDTLGITFSLESGKVHHMIVRLGGVETKPPSIEVK